MKELVFLLEERSAEALLEELLPRMLPDGITFRLIPFEGKQDLEKQLVRKIRSYQSPSAAFLVMRDQDSAPDCRTVKAKLAELCRQAGKSDVTVRIACHELESFYLADLKAVEQALGIRGLASHQGKSKFRNPDSTPSPSQELNRLTSGLYQKVSGSRAIGALLDLDNTRSPSFRNLIAAIRTLVGDGS